MKIIALDTSGLVASAAILEDGILRAEYTVNYKKTHSQTLLSMLDEISKMTSLDLATVDAIAVAAGPGSFTGLRIGSATAKGLGFALNKPIIEVPTLDALAFNLYDAPGLICPMMDARRQQVYNAVYRFENHRLTAVTSQRAIAAHDLMQELNGNREAAQGVIFLGDGVAVSSDIIKNELKAPYSIAPAHLNRQRAGAVAALGALLFSEGKYVSAADHVPVYLRKSQAEQQKEKTAEGRKAEAQKEEAQKPENREAESFLAGKI